MKLNGADDVLDVHAPLAPEIISVVKKKVKPKDGSFPESLLQSIVPRGDRNEINGALRKGVTLAKKRKKTKWRFIPPKNRALTAQETRSQRRKLFQRKAFSYDDLVPLHALWNEYAGDYLDIDRCPGSAVEGGAVIDTSEAETRTMLTKLGRLELHGSEVTVQRAHCPSAVGLSGIVVQETRFALRFVTRKNEMKTVLKDGSVFDVEVGGMVFSLLGSSIMTRPADRAARKIKLLQHVFQFGLK